MMTNVQYVCMCDTLEKNVTVPCYVTCVSHSGKYNHGCFLFLPLQYTTRNHQSENNSHIEREKKGGKKKEKQGIL